MSDTIGTMIKYNESKSKVVYSDLELSVIKYNNLVSLLHKFSELQIYKTKGDELRACFCPRCDRKYKLTKDGTVSKPILNHLIVCIYPRQSLSKYWSCNVCHNKTYRLKKDGSPSQHIINHKMNCSEVLV